MHAGHGVGCGRSVTSAYSVMQRPETCYRHAEAITAHPADLILMPGTRLYLVDCTSLQAICHPQVGR